MVRLFVGPSVDDWPGCSRGGEVMVGARIDQLRKSARASAAGGRAFVRRWRKTACWGRAVGVDKVRIRVISEELRYSYVLQVWMKSTLSSRAISEVKWSETVGWVTTHRFLA